VDPASIPLTVILNVLSNPDFWVPAFLMLVLLVGSALASGSEVAFFSLGPADLSSLREEDSPSSRRLLQLLESPDIEAGPRNLLATILVLNNLINIVIILLSTVVSEALIPKDSLPPLAEVLINVFGVTFLIVLFGEVIPKVYATSYNVQLARVIAGPLIFCQRILFPVWRPLVGMGNIINRNFKRTSTTSISVEDLEHALELTDNHQRSDEEKKILEGIVSFGSKDVKQIMTPRMDVFAVSKSIPWSEALPEVLESGYSRIPVFEGSIDEIVGILYIKDLLPHIDQSDFHWQSMLRTPIYVPANKKIDDLLREFQERKTHMAVVVDEYGGTSGIITLEDIIEEIVGEITDEFDEEDLSYTRIDDRTVVFEGKTPLIDVYRVLDIDGEDFEQAKADSDTLSGFVVELAGKIPLKGERYKFNRCTLTVEASDKRKVKRIKVSIEDEHTEISDPL
jgi:gliding motility-associated protein GldE